MLKREDKHNALKDTVVYLQENPWCI